jgi:alpha-tubulin suppressor-like RCC1 family protein
MFPAHYNRLLSLANHRASRTDPRAADCDAVLSWGRGEDGQLGHGGAEECQEPRVIHALLGEGVSQVCCGAEFTVAVSSRRQEVYSWGW